jgi:hypothetical protein
LSSFSSVCCLSVADFRAVLPRREQVSYFQEHAEKLTVDVLGNLATGEPRSFSSGNRGWYLGGKVEVMIGKKKLWANLGLNLTIVGSKNWSD